MTTERKGRQYGDSILIGDSNPNFFNQSPQQQALDLAWSEACPVAPDLIQKRGEVEMLHRYGEVLFYYGYLLEELKNLGQDKLIEQLTQVRPRLLTEPLGEHCSDWVPSELYAQVFRSAASYALPRILTEYLKQHQDSDDFWERFNFATDTFRECALAAGNQDQLAVFFAEDLACELIREGHSEESTNTILRRLLSLGKYQEDHLATEYNKIIEYLFCEPILRRAYSELTHEERHELGIYSPKQT